MHMYKRNIFIFLLCINISYFAKAEQEDPEITRSCEVLGITRNRSLERIELAYQQAAIKQHEKISQYEEEYKKNLLV